MRKMKRWLALGLAAALCAAALGGCAEQEQTQTLSVCAGGEVVTFDPIFIVSASDATVAVNLYENLMRLTTDVAGNTVVTEGMARSVDVEENVDGTVTYTFRLRSARWSDGREVKAGDFVYAWQRLANPLSLSPNAALLSMVRGYEAVRGGADLSELGVAAKNDSTLEVTLTGKYDWFLSDVCTAAATMPLRQDVVQALKERAAGETGEGRPTLKWWYDPTRLVTNGPYHVAGCVPGESMTLAANERYYGETGPDVLNFTFADETADAWALYDAGEVDFVAQLPGEQIQTIQAENPEWAPTPQLYTAVTLFNGNQLPFDDSTVRAAFSLAVNRTALATAVGGAAQAADGLVPNGVPGGEEQDFRAAGGALLRCDPEGYEERCKEARTLLAQSSFDDRYDLEYLYVSDPVSDRAVKELTRQWKDALGVNVRPKAVTAGELSVALLRGEYLMAGTGKIAMANDAEAFLRPFASRSEQNVIHYANSAYDTLLSIIDSASDAAARLACLHDAEALLLDDAALCPLYSTSTAWKLRETYTGLCRDARGQFCFAGVVPASA